MYPLQLMFWWGAVCSVCYKHNLNALRLLLALILMPSFTVEDDTFPSFAPVRVGFFKLETFELVTCG